MNVWHLTTDAPRMPRRVSPGERADLWIGTWPVEPGQSVHVTWSSVSADGTRAEGRVEATWHHNSAANSYWAAHLGPFRDQDDVTYAVHGSSAGGDAETTAHTLRVRPALFIAWLWHQHQPLYRNPSAPDARGSYRYPWVRLHALRDYYSMNVISAG